MLVAPIDERADSPARKQSSSGKGMRYLTAAKSCIKQIIVFQIKFPLAQSSPLPSFPLSRHISCDRVVVGQSPPIVGHNPHPADWPRQIPTRDKEPTRQEKKEALHVETSQVFCLPVCVPVAFNSTSRRIRGLEKIK